MSFYFKTMEGKTIPVTPIRLLFHCKFTLCKGKENPTVEYNILSHRIMVDGEDRMATTREVMAYIQPAA